MTELILKNTGQVATNLYTFSEELDNAVWNKTRLNETGTPPWVNVGISPDGTQTAEKLIPNTDNQTHFLIRTQLNWSGKAVFSGYFKADGYTGIYVILRGGTNFANRVQIRINLNNGNEFSSPNEHGTFVGSNYQSEVTPVANGWYRISISCDVPSSETNILTQMIIMDGNTASFIGNNTDGVLAWGLQLSNSFGPYVKTTSTTKSTLLGTKVLEIDEKYGVATEGCISDIRDLEKTSGASSKTLYITSNDEANRILGSIFNINIDDSLSFDLQKKQECELWHNGEKIMDGFFQIANIDYIDKFNYLYEIVVYDEQINLFLEIEENLITGNSDPSKDLDFSQYDHQYIWDNVEGSFNKGPYELPYAYLLFDNERTFWNNVDDYKPGFYVESLYKEIFAKYGYTIESDFFKEDLFQDLVIPFATRDDLPFTDELDLEERSLELDNVLQPTTAQFCSTGIFGDGAIITDTRNFGTPYYLDPDVVPIVTPTVPLANFGAIVPFVRIIPPIINSNLFRAPNSCLRLQSSNAPLLYSNIYSHTPEITGKYNYEVSIPFNLRLTNDDIQNIFSQATQQNPNRRVKFRINVIKMLNPINTTSTTPNHIDIYDLSKYEIVASQFVESVEVWPTILANDTAFIDGVVSATFNNLILQSGGNYVITITMAGMNYAIPSPGGPLPRQALANVRFGIDNNENLAATNWKITALQGFVSEGDSVLLSQWMPQIKQRDFIKSINKMFNLKMAPLKGKEKTILIEPRDDFYRKGQQINLNNNDQFYIINSESKYNVLTEFQTREVLLKWDDDSDSTPREVDLQDPQKSTGDSGKFLLHSYKTSYKQEYGQQRILFNNENTKNEITIEPIFSPTPIIRSTDFVTNAQDTRRYITSAISAIIPKNNFRILLKNVLPNTLPYVAIQNRPIRSFFTGTNLGNAGIENGRNFTWFFPGEYCTATHFQEDPLNPKFDLNWGRPLELNFDFDRLTDNNLFQDFWLNTVRQFNEQKMITVKAYISSTQYDQLDWNTKLYADLNEYSGWFIINKIKEYNVKTGEAILELITYDIGLEFDLRRPIPFVTGTLPNFTTSSTSVPKPGPNVSGTGNITQGAAIAFGNFNKSSTKSLTIGDNNANYGGIVLGDNNNVQSKKSIILGDSHTGEIEEGSLISKGVSTSKISLNTLTEDPLDPQNGQIWFREDLSEFRIYLNGVKKLDLSDTGDEDEDSGMGQNEA
jgi:hypothetical protein